MPSYILQWRNAILGKAWCKPKSSQRLSPTTQRLGKQGTLSLILRNSSLCVICEISCRAPTPGWGGGWFLKPQSSRRVTQGTQSLILGTELLLCPL